MDDIVTDTLTLLRQKLIDELGWDEPRVLPLRVEKRVFSRIVEATLTSGNGRAENVIIKIYGVARGSTEDAVMHQIRNEFEIMRRLWGELREHPVFSVARPLVFLPERHALVMSKSPGRQFQSILTRKARFRPGGKTMARLESLCHACGRWLKWFQWNADSDLNGKLDLDDMIEKIDYRLERLVDCEKADFDEKLRSRTLRRLEMLSQDVAESDLYISAVHGDFFPGNVLANGQKITILDFAMYRTGSVFTDVTYFWHQLDTLLLKPVYRQSVIRRLQHAFLLGYDDCLASTDPFETKALFKLFRLQHLVYRIAAIYLVGEPTFTQRLYNQVVARECLRRLKKEIDGADHVLRV